LEPLAVTSVNVFVAGPVVTFTVVDVVEPLTVY